MDHVENFFDVVVPLMPTIGDAFVLQSTLVPFARNAIIDNGKDTFLTSDPQWDSLQLALKSASSMTSVLNQTLSRALEFLEGKLAQTPPYPTSSDHYAVGVLRLVQGNYSGATMAFQNAGKLVRVGIGLAAKVEALFALKRYDDVIACVIEADPSSVSSSSSSSSSSSGSSITSSSASGISGGPGSQGDEEGGGKKSGFMVKAFQSLLMRSSLAEPEVPTPFYEDDLKHVQDLPLLRRALSYYELQRVTGIDVYTFKSSEDFALLFQRAQNHHSNSTLMGMFKASKAMITEDSETACALLHQASSLMPLRWEFPYFKAIRRARTDPRAIVEIEAAIRLDPENRHLRVVRCMLFVEQKRHADALKDLHPLVLADSDNLVLCALRARARQFGGDLEGALADYRRCRMLVEKIEPDSPKLVRFRSRVLYELAHVEMNIAHDPDKERLGLNAESQRRVEELLNKCIAADTSSFNFGAYKLRAALMMEQGRLEQAASDYMDFVVQLHQRCGGDLDTLSRECSACVRMYRKLDDYLHVATVAGLMLTALGAAKEKDLEVDPSALAHWKYWMGVSKFKLGDKESALALGLEAWHILHEANVDDDGKDRSRIQTLVVRCGGSLSEKPAAAAPKPHPVVPLLQLGKIQTPQGRRRRKTVTNNNSTNSSSNSVLPLPETTLPVLMSSTELPEPVELPGGMVPVAPPAPAVYDGELPAPPKLQSPPRSGGSTPKSGREKELLREIARLNAELDEARKEIARLKQEKK